MVNNQGKETVFERHFANSAEDKTLRDQRIDMGMARHIAPYSTLIAAIGQHWRKGSKEAVLAMAEYTWRKGIVVTVYEEPDCCFQPYDALGVMRNRAYTRAIREGYEYILYVDNDVLPPEDALYRLLMRQVPIISPIIVYTDGSDHGLNLPKTPQGQGLAMITGCVVLSFLLFKTSVFFPWATIPFWQDAIGASENYHFERLAMAGHQAFVDTDFTVACVDPPHFPLDKIVARTAEDLDRTRTAENRVSRNAG